MNHTAMENENPPLFTRGVLLAIAALYLASGIILWTQVGPWEAVRKAAVNGLILLAWLGGARYVLRGAPAPQREPVHYPRIELAWVLLVLGIVVAIVAAAHAGWTDPPWWAVPLFVCGGVGALFIALAYPLRAWGFAWPSRRAWLALLLVVLVNVGATALFRLFPPGEAEPVPQADLANQITGPWTVIVLLLRLLVTAALPEELLFRVTLQPRLARFVPLGWAMLIQALLFSAAHLPQKLIGYQEPWLVAIAYTLTVNNGLIGGYLWWRTRSLPLLLLLHLFAYPRFGI